MVLTPPRSPGLAIVKNKVMNDILFVQSEETFLTQALIDPITLRVVMTLDPDWFLFKRMNQSEHEVRKGFLSIVKNDSTHA